MKDDSSEPSQSQPLQCNIQTVSDPTNFSIPASPFHSNLHILHFNARTYYPKLLELKASCDLNILMFFVSLRPGSLQWHIWQWCYRLDRNRRGDGVAVYIQDNLNMQVLLRGPMDGPWVNPLSVYKAHCKVFSSAQPCFSGWQPASFALYI